MVTTFPSETFTYRGRPWHRRVEAFYEHWTLGVDLGQAADYTAVSLLQHVREPLDEFREDDKRGILTQKVRERFNLRGLRRFPLGTSYPDQVRLVADLLARTPDADLAIDQTGPGAAVGDLFARHGLKPVRVTITGGAEVTKHGQRRFGVPKSIIVSNIDARLHCGELRFAKDLPDADTLADELQNFQRHVTAAGRSIFEARASKHDDVVLSVGIALWWAIERKKHRMKSGLLKGLAY